MIGNDGCQMLQKQLNPKQIVIQKSLDENKETSRAYHKFRQSIKTPTTLRAYNYSLDKFMTLSNLKSYDRVIKLNGENVQGLLEDYIISLKNYRFQTANLYLAGVELFLDMNMVLYHKKILRKLLPNNDAEQGGKLPYKTEEIERMLSVTTKLRTKAVIHYLASTGSRPAGIEDPVLRLKHIEDMPHNCKSVFIYDGSKQGYHAFLTPEASKSLNNYLRQRKLKGEILTEESPVFVNIEGFPTARQEHLSQSSARQMVRDMVLKAGIERIKKGKRYDKAIIYGFRKRFNTILKLNNDVNSNIAEKLMAHKRGLDGTYLQPTREECFAEFLKAIPQLTIDDSERKQALLDVALKEKSGLEQQRQQNQNLEQRIEKQEKQIKELFDYAFKKIERE